ncbi:MAG: sulfotransferase family protein [Chitinophagales bacterium]
MIQKPNFFIVGAAKSGTTALYEYLKKHPHVFMPPKELYYFGKDFTFREAHTPLDYYLSFFKTVPSSAKQIGEASVWYLYSKTAAAEIKAFQPNAKIIVMLREPTEMLYSLHSQQLFSGNEDIENFELALQAESERRKGKRLPPYIGCPYEALYYSEVARYYEQVKRYIETFGSENVHVILFDDFVKDTKKEYQKCLSFLGLVANIEVSFERINANKTVRFASLRNVLKRRPKFLIQLSKIILPYRVWRHRVQDWMYALNSKKQERVAMNEATRTFLKMAFRKDVEQLESLIKRDLSNWKS